MTGFGRCARLLASIFQYPFSISFDWLSWVSCGIWSSRRWRRGECTWKEKLEPVTILSVCWSLKFYGTLRRMPPRWRKLTTWRCAFQLGKKVHCKFRWLSVNNARSRFQLRKPVPMLSLLSGHQSLNFKTCTRLSRHCRKAWVHCGQIKAVSRSNVRQSLKEVVILEMFRTVQERRIIVCVRKSWSLRPTIITNWFTSGMSVMVCKPTRTFMIVVRKCPTNFPSRM